MPPRRRLIAGHVSKKCDRLATYGGRAEACQRNVRPLINSATAPRRSMTSAVHQSRTTVSQSFEGWGTLQSRVESCRLRGHTESRLEQRKFVGSPSARDIDCSLRKCRISEGLDECKRLRLFAYAGRSYLIPRRLRSLGGKLLAVLKSTDHATTPGKTCALIALNPKQSDAHLEAEDLCRLGHSKPLAHGG